MGCSMTLESATRTALIESVQMLRSLDSGREVGPSLTDMRRIWYDGTSKSVFPTFFAGTERPTDSLQGVVREEGGDASPEALLETLVDRAARVGVQFYRYVFASVEGFAAVRCIADRILPLDDLYFPHLVRFADWDEGIGPNDWNYRGPLFM